MMNNFPPFARTDKATREMLGHQIEFADASGLGTPTGLRMWTYMVMSEGSAEWDVVTRLLREEITGFFLFRVDFNPTAGEAWPDDIAAPLPHLEKGVEELAATLDSNRRIRERAKDTTHVFDISKYDVETDRFGGLTLTPKEDA